MCLFLFFMYSIYTHRVCVVYNWCTLWFSPLSRWACISSIYLDTLPSSAARWRSLLFLQQFRANSADLTFRSSERDSFLSGTWMQIKEWHLMGNSSLESPVEQWIRKCWTISSYQRVLTRSIYQDKYCTGNILATHMNLAIYLSVQIKDFDLLYWRVVFSISTRVNQMDSSPFREHLSI